MSAASKANEPHSTHVHGEGCLACDEGPEAMKLSVEAMIARYGHAVIATHVDAPEGMLNMSFTVGLSRQGRPELIVFALAANVAQAVLNTCAKKVLADEAPLNVGIANVVDPYDIVLKEADIARVREVTLALEEFSGVATPAVLQMVWPDTRGAFPWDQEFDPALRAFQPTLYDTAP